MSKEEVEVRSGREVVNVSEYRRFVEDFASRINFDQIAHDIIASEQGEQDVEELSRLSVLHSQLTFLRLCQFEIEQGVLHPQSALQARRELLTQFALDMNQHGYIGETNQQLSLSDNSEHIRASIDSIKGKVAICDELQGELSDVSWRYKIAHQDFGSTIYLGLNHITQHNGINGLNRIMSDLTHDFSFFSPDILKSAISSDAYIDARYLDAMERQADELIFYARIAGYFPANSDSDAERQKRIDIAYQRSDGLLPLMLVDDPREGVVSLVESITRDEIYEVLRLIIPFLAFDGITLIDNTFDGHEHTFLMPSILMRNILARHGNTDIVPTMIAPTMTVNDYSESVAITAGFDTAKGHETSRVDVVGRSIVSTHIEFGLPLYVLEGTNVADTVLTAGMYMHTLLHEIGEHIRRNLLTVDDMREWNKLTDQGVIPITRYVQENMDDRDRAAKEAFCDSIGMLDEAAYILHIVAPDYLTFVVDLLEKNMPTVQKGKLREYVEKQIHESRVFWESQGYTDDQVRNEYLASFISQPQ